MEYLFSPGHRTKLNVHKTFRRCPGHFLNILCTFNLRSVSRGVIICHQHQTRSGKIKTNKTQQISVQTQVFFVKTELRHIELQLAVNHFIIFVDISF